MKKIAICIWGAISGTILLSHCTFSDKGVRRIDNLLAGLSEEDNNVIMWGEFK